MEFLDELQVLVKARYPILSINTYEEERFEQKIKNLKTNDQELNIYSWDFVDGLKGNPKDNNVGKKDPLKILDYIEKYSLNKPNTNISTLFLLKDFDTYLKDFHIVRKIKNIIKTLKIKKVCLVLISPQQKIPETLTDLITKKEFQLPNELEIKTELTRVLKALDKEIDNETLKKITQACRGLSLERIQRILSKILVQKNTLDITCLFTIYEEKRATIAQTQTLEIYQSNETLKKIGGLENLKDWLKIRKEAFSDEAKEYGLKTPKGLLLIGVQGTGKSLSSKAIANEWNLPLIRLDVGSIFGGIVGESENRIRETIKIVEAIAPCVLWIDEIDKGFGDFQSASDGGTSGRVLSTFITWLSEKTSQVFVVATANKIEKLPLEILRKGRFDEIFFVGLPNEDERKAIIKILLNRVRPQTINTYDIDKISQQTKRFSGAEIEQTIYDAMYSAFNKKQEFTTNDIIESAKQIIPLALTAEEEITLMEDWALAGRARLASKKVY